jgi:hypothetical protein
MVVEGNILKMRTDLGFPVDYYLPVGDKEVYMNSLIGNRVRLSFSGTINCISCGKRTKRSFSQGFCYRCLQTAPEAAESVIRPALSKSHYGIARNMEWAEKQDLIDHIVYLAVACELKVGVTRHTGLPERWIDQGATYAVKLAVTPSRHIAGVMELYLSRFITDRTRWQSMLTGPGNDSINLSEEKQRVYGLLPSELQKYYCHNNEVVHIQYPMIIYPDKVKGFAFDKEPVIEGALKGIKGQYLVFDDGRVLNIRKHNGYYLQIETIE